MKVRELKQALQDIPEDMEIYIQDADTGWSLCLEVAFEVDGEFILASDYSQVKGNSK